MGKLVEVRHFYDPTEAQCAKGYLESLGFMAVLSGEHLPSVKPGILIAQGGIRLLVPEEDAGDVRTILDELDGQTSRLESNQSSAGKCTKCGGNLKRADGWMDTLIAILGTVGLGAGVGPRKKGLPMRCRNCGHRQSGLED